MPKFSKSTSIFAVFFSALRTLLLQFLMQCFCRKLLRDDVDKDNGQDEPDIVLCFPTALDVQGDVEVVLHDLL